MSCGCNNNCCGYGWCGCGCSCCSSYNVCEKGLPDGCDALEISANAQKLVVEDEDFCRKTLPVAENNSVAVQNEDGVSWADGSTTSPLNLPALQSQNGGTVPEIAAQKASGDITGVTPTSTQTEPEVFLGTQGTGWAATERSAMFGTGNGLLSRPTTTDVAIWKNGTTGQIPYVDASGDIQFGAPNSLISTASLPAQNLAIQRSTTSTIAITAQFLVVRNASTFTQLSGVSVSLSATVTGLGGLDTGAISSGTLYWLYVIYNPTTATAGAVFSINSGSPTLPAGYTQYRRVGAAATASLTTFALFSQMGNVWSGNVAAVGFAPTPNALAVASSNFATSSTGQSLAVPAASSAKEVFLAATATYTSASSSTLQFVVSNSASSTTNFVVLGFTLGTLGSPGTSQKLDQGWLPVNPATSTLSFGVFGTFGTYTAGDGAYLTVAGYRWNFI